MYAKCSEFGKAEILLGIHQSRDVVPWTALITGYIRDGRSQVALECLEYMLHEGICPNVVTYSCILKACASLGALKKGEEIHEDLIRQDLLQDNVVIGTALVDMYAKCGALSKAHGVLEKLSFRDVVCWSALISGYTQNGQGEQALYCFECMLREGILPNAVTYTCVLKACALTGALDKGKHIHFEIINQGLLYNNVELGNALVDMYAKCGALANARDVLEKLSARNVITWNALISGYLQANECELALRCFECMQQEGVLPDAVTYISILRASAALGALHKGIQIHKEVIQQGLLQDNVMIGTALVDMYAKCGVLSMAHDVIEQLPSRNVVTWSALIAGYADTLQGDEALNCFERMLYEGIFPNAVTYACALKACTAIGALEKGKELHDQILKQGLLQDNVVLGNALVYMYAKCGALFKAHNVLKELTSRDVVTWSALIAGYVEHGQGEGALDCFDSMLHDGIFPNAVTYVSILKACALLGALYRGEQIHDEIIRHGFLQDNVVLGNALVDMYAKCGALLKAKVVLENLPSRDTISWNALIAGYAQAGKDDQLLKCLARMQDEGISPNAASFACVLNLYGHLGRIEQALAQFLNMSNNYNMKPDLECVSCVIDLLARAGHLENALYLTQDIDFSGIWLAILGACWKCGDFNSGRVAFERAVELDKCDGPTYVLMANIYAATGVYWIAEGTEFEGSVMMIEAGHTDND
ncbi:hypothetical protein KP509_10G031500 [Ceratopteris richardii]|nr:hypothetical protein KP509_10G031500 [Ceratopteris richardii]